MLYFHLHKKALLIGIPVTLIMGMGIGLALVHFVFAKPSVQEIKLTSSITTSTPTPTLAPPYNFLNGTIMTQTQYNQLMQNRPLAVMIPNDVPSRPQSGVNNADIVYEALVEGNYTRF